MKDGICYVVGAGEDYGIAFRKEPGDYVIAVDAGLRYVEKLGVEPDLVIGDFDSLQYIPSYPNVRRLNAEKDDTDMGVGIQEGIRAGYTVFRIYGGTGGRIDHTLGNLQLLAGLAERGMQVFLYDKENVVTAITDSGLCFGAVPEGYISVFSYSPRSEGVTLHGLKYRLENAVVTNTFPIGVSNEFIGLESSIRVEKGTLVVVFPRFAEGKLLRVKGEKNENH